MPFIGTTLRYAPDGDFIVFFDKHGNGIASRRYSGPKPPTETELTAYHDQFDLSVANYDGYDESLCEEPASLKESSCTIL